MSDDLLKRMARALASADGNQMNFETCEVDPSRERDEGCFARYMNTAEQLLRKSGIAEEIYRLRCGHHESSTQFIGAGRSPISPCAELLAP